MQRSITLLAVLLIFGCTSSPHDQSHRVDETNYLQVTLGASLEDDKSNEPYRFWGDAIPKALASNENEGFDQQRVDNLTSSKNGPQVFGDTFNVLVLSGGGPRGAFGAGVLNGLNDSGNLPEYSLITGVSAGALIAPFVFVGGDKIDQMKQVMLGLDDDKMLGGTSFFSFLFGDAFSEGNNFYQMISEIYNDDFIVKIAKQHRAGRRLFIGTTHFDSGRQMIWNLGRIADSDLPNKSELIHQILTASSSIPGVFPPQFIPVNFEGTTLEEMHVDGGLSNQLFFDPIGFDYTSFVRSLGIDNAPQVYTIRNGRLRTEFKFIEDDTISLASRSIDNLILAQTRGDVVREVYVTERIGAHFFLTYVDDDYTDKPAEGKFFDSAYLKTLYDYGYNKGINNQAWVDKLPLTVRD
ncbi:patatin-like phospholipase family protein [Vibrio splendidus]|uniref:patatin-like phospholipase family protein n=1 Tax=Vibrio splendidus TaxID=29497 RepID=UPI000A7A311F|nr:patatin-like phospholipase family protein [Vibrio splendidus]